MKINEKLSLIQAKLKVGKGHRNEFGKYNYRNLSDIFEGLKPILKEIGCSITVSDEIICVNDFNYIKATATLDDGSNSISTTGWARESVQKKGMDDSQITGATSSYARKYALNGLFAIDDTEDADSMDNREHETVVLSPSISKKPNKEVKQVSDEWNEESRSSGIPFGKYKGTPWKDVPEDYIGWLIDKSDNSNWRTMANAELVARMTQDASSEQQDAAKDSSSTNANKKATPSDDFNESQIEEGKELMDELKNKLEEEDNDLPF